MELLGAECEACFGCDNCEHPDTGGVHEFAAEGVRSARGSVIRLIGMNQRMLTTEQVARIVRGRPERADRWVPRRLPGWSLKGVFCRAARSTGLAEGWSQEELLELIEGLRTTGVVHTAGRGPWRGRLMVRRRERAVPVGVMGGPGQPD